MMVSIFLNPVFYLRCRVHLHRHHFRVNYSLW
uniref:Uncharacterized protein n=1 Tax=Romanomermis culicivorax TaxID=13658 RepID=A0A915JN06_ROMCU